MTQNDRDELKRLEAAATPGPCKVNRAIIGHSGTTSVSTPGSFDWICAMQVSNQPNWNNDAEFIVTARNAVLDLLTENQKMRELLEDVARRIDIGSDYFDN